MTEAGKPTIVLKFGGSSLKDRECIEKVLDIIVSRVEKGFAVVTVVSAQGKTTENLLGYVRDFAPNGNPRETDMLLIAHKDNCTFHELGFARFSKIKFLSTIS